MNKIIIILSIISIILSIKLLSQEIKKRDTVNKEQQKAELINNIMDCAYLTESKQLKWCLEKYL